MLWQDGSRNYMGLQQTESSVYAPTCKFHHIWFYSFSFAFALLHLAQWYNIIGDDTVEKLQ